MISLYKKFPGGKRKKGPGRRPVLALILTGTVFFCLSGCGMEGGKEEERRLLTLAGGLSREALHEAAASLANAVNTTGSGLYVELQESKGSPVSIINLCQGEYDLALVSGDAVFDAWNGEGVFEGEKQEDFRVLMACYPVASQWLSLKSSGLSYVNGLEGKNLSAGIPFSATGMASEAVFDALEMVVPEERLWQRSLADSAALLRDGTVDGIHGFAAVPAKPFKELAGGTEITVLRYTDEELEKLLSPDGPYRRITIPAGTYPGQETPVETFGFPVLLCAPETMEDSVVRAVLTAVEESGIPARDPYLSATKDKEFICMDLPAPLHDGARQYFEEKGYFIQK